MNEHIIDFATGRQVDLDPVWQRVRKEGAAIIEAEPDLGRFVQQNVMDQPSLEAAIVSRLASRLDHVELYGVGEC